MMPNRISSVPFGRRFSKYRNEGRRQIREDRRVVERRSMLCRQCPWPGLEVIELYREDGKPLPPPTSGKDFANKTQRIA
jgi:hypothetical protein